MILDWGTNSNASGVIDGNTVTYHVNVSDHNNELGEYSTHIYAYDNSGNCSGYGIDVTIYQSGNLNQDTNITILDAVLLQKHLLSLKSLTAEQMQLADINGDGVVNVFDMSLLKTLL